MTDNSWQTEWWPLSANSITNSICMEWAAKTKKAIKGVFISFFFFLINKEKHWRQSSHASWVLMLQLNDLTTEWVGCHVCRWLDRFFLVRYRGETVLYRSILLIQISILECCVFCQHAIGIDSLFSLPLRVALWFFPVRPEIEIRFWSVWVAGIKGLRSLAVGHHLTEPSTNHRRSSWAAL